MTNLRDEIERGPHWALETGEPESDREYATRIALQALEEAARIFREARNEIEGQQAIRAFAATLTPDQRGAAARVFPADAQQATALPSAPHQSGSPNAQEE